jgi:oligoendopeptidase F
MMQATFFRQALFAEFELKAHEIAEKETPLTLTLLKDLYKDLYRQYYGPELFIDDKVGIEWARVPHFYYNFYVYQYCTGIASAFKLFERVKKEENGCQEYLAFLKSGSSQYPLDALKSAGVDLTKKEPIEAFIRRFEKLMDELEELTKNQTS